MSYKKLDLDKDVSTNGYFIHEGVRFYYKFLSGTAGEQNIRLPNHFVTGGVSGSYYLDVYDKNRDDISSNRLLSITYGHTSSSVYCSGAFVATYQEPKIKMYRLMAKRLLGSEDSKFIIDGTELNEAVFLCISRNQYKDNVVGKGSLLWYYLTGSPGSEPIGTANFSVLTDFYSKQDTVFAGPITYLKDLRTNKNRGLVFLNAGIFVIDPTTLATSSYWSGTMNFEQLAKGVSGTTYNDLIWSIKNRIYYWDFSGSSRVESTFYKCTAQPYEFNYSSNPSFTLPTGEVITAISASNPTTYITQVGLLGANNELIAIAKLQKPVRKNPHRGVTITVRVDY